MQNRDLARDYVKRAETRLKAIAVLLQEKSWADVVRESQESVELALKGFLRACGIEAPRVHDVSAILLSSEALLPGAIKPHLVKLAEISKNLRRDRELAFYGSEDLTPLEFYSQADGEKALKDAEFVVRTVKPHVK